MVKPLCSTCKFLKGDKWDERDCIKCLPPLMAENHDAAWIYLIVQNQLILGPQGPIAVNQMAIHEAMQLYEIENKLDCFEKVLKLSSYFIEKMRLARE